MKSDTEKRTVRLIVVVILLLALSLGLKIALLMTSQSMADGDESVEGIMAMHLVEEGTFQVYPYGVNYGAGAGVEVLIAALTFKLFGISDVTLKMAGLIIWLMTSVMIFLYAESRYGLSAAMIALLLFSFAPQTAQWSLKVAGGHQVAVLLGLCLLVMIEKEMSPLIIAWLIPITAVAHPIAITFVVFVALYLLVEQKGARRTRYLVSLVIAVGVVVSCLLLSSSEGVHDPSAKGLDIFATFATIPQLLVTFFTPNLSSRTLPDGFQLVVSLFWLTSLVVLLIISKKDRFVLMLAVSTFATIFLVTPFVVTARHILLIGPLSCLLLSQGISRIPHGFQYAFLSTLLLSGALVQIKEMGSPYIHGAGVQSTGVSRKEVREIVKTLDDLGIRHVYSFDGMLQWNLIFQSREKIIARWRNSVDRLSRYPLQVDRARLSGEPVALIGYPRESFSDDGPQSFQIYLQPDPSNIERYFPLSPYLSKDATQGKDSPQ